jgi:signal transduction histidine kinase
MKHADATRETVRISVAAGQVILEVSDNGRGFDVDQAERNGGMGLINMRERARQMGGAFEIISSAGEGVLVRVVAPILTVVQPPR